MTGGAGSDAFWFEADGSVQGVVSFSRDMHAESGGFRGGDAVYVQAPAGDARAFVFFRAEGIVRLSSGVVVVQQTVGAKVESYSATTTSAWLSEGRASVRGSVAVQPDGTVSEFRTRMQQVAAWGDNHIWGLQRGGRQLVGTDASGAVFFRRRIEGRAEAVYHGGGVRVVTRDDAVSCFGLDEQLVASFATPGATSFVMDDSGRMYAGSSSGISAFEVDGTLRWQEEVPGRYGPLVLLPTHGLCTARDGDGVTLAAC